MYLKQPFDFSNDSFLWLNDESVFPPQDTPGQGEPSALNTIDAGPERLRALWDTLKGVSQGIKDFVARSELPRAGIERLNIERMLRYLDVCSLWLLFFARFGPELDEQFVQDRLDSIDAAVGEMQDWLST